jgi:hypothetical protein
VESGIILIATKKTLAAARRRRKVMTIVKIGAVAPPRENYFHAKEINKENPEMAQNYRGYIYRYRHHTIFRTGKIPVSS